MQVLQRDAVRTKKALLEAAEQVMLAEGPGVSLDKVARQAGVSKGGLLHHFPSRDALLTALVEDWLERFDQAVARHLDDDDHRPGRLCRAHIRASFDDAGLSGGPWSNNAVQVALLSVPGVLERARAAGERWQRELVADGLHRQRVLLISRVLDGETTAEIMQAGSDRVEREEIRDLLLALTEETGPLVAPKAG